MPCLLACHLVGKKISPQAQVHCFLEAWPKHEGHTTKVVNACGFSPMGSKAVSSIRIHRQTISPSTSAFLLTFAYITPLKIVNTVLDVFAHILVEAFYVLGTLLNDAQTISFNPFNNPARFCIL